MIKKIVFCACCLLSHVPLFGAFHEKVPLLSPDMDAHQLSNATRFLEKVFYNTPNEDRTRITKIIAEQAIPAALNHMMSRLNFLGEVLSEEAISRENLLGVLDDLLQANRHGNRLQQYGEADPELLRVFRELEIEGVADNMPILQNDPKILFLKSFVDDGKNYIQNVYAQKLEKAVKDAQKAQERYDILSPEEKVLAQEIIHVYTPLHRKLSDFKYLGGNDLKEKLSDFMGQQSYRDIKERFDAIHEQFEQGNHLTLAEILQDILNDKGLEG